MGISGFKGLNAAQVSKTFPQLKNTGYRALGRALTSKTVKRSL
jgi:hypothetical protein